MNYESVALSFGSFKKTTSNEIRRRWQNVIAAGYEKAPKTKEERRKDWEEMKSWF